MAVIVTDMVAVSRLCLGVNNNHINVTATTTTTTVTVTATITGTTVGIVSVVSVPIHTTCSRRPPGVPYHVPIVCIVPPFDTSVSPSDTANAILVNMANSRPVHMHTTTTTTTTAAAADGGASTVVSTTRGGRRR
jgi:hypothetical protein